MKRHKSLFDEWQSSQAGGGIGITFFFAQGIDGSQGSEWIKVAPGGAGFSVMMPAKPEEEVQPRVKLTAHLFSFTSDTALYFVAYGDYAPGVRFNVDDELEANRDRFQKDLMRT